MAVVQLHTTVTFILEGEGNNATDFQIATFRYHNLANSRPSL